MQTFWTKRIAPFIDYDVRRTVLLGILGAVLVSGLILGLGDIITGLVRIITHPSQLISDYIVIGGPGPALVNAALVGLVGVTFLIVLKVDVTGPSTAAILTMTGFGLFGKNIVNILPIFAGVWLYSRVDGGGMRRFLLPAFFGSTMGPVVSQVAFGTSLGWVFAITVGVVAGFVISPLAAHMLRNHQGFNLYNLGFTGGFIGIFVAALLRGFGKDIPVKMIWGTDHTPLFAGLLLVLCTALVATGIIMSRGKLAGYKEILKHPGTLVTDYMTLVGFGPTLINMGAVGFIALAYLVLVGGDINGPTAGGVLTIIGFGAFGKHPRNIWPLMLGVWLATFIFQWPVASPNALLAALFATTMAPISMQFGWPIGIVAGALHLLVVNNVSSVHGGLNLYNNGFSGGLIATVIVAVYRGLKNDE